MVKTKEIYEMDSYKEYETRPVNPQECAPAQTSYRIGSKDFTHNCVFERQLTYPHIQDNLYLVEMESGKKAVYERRIKDEGSYRGTGQHDWDFSFIRYMDDSEFEVIQTKTPMGFSKIIVKLNDGVKI